MSDQTDASMLDEETKATEETKETETKETKQDTKAEEKDSFFEDGFGKWTAALPKEFQKDERLKGMRGPGDAVKRMFELEEKYGGVPDKPADYDFEMPELPDKMPVDEENINTFKNLAYTAGIGKAAANKIFKGFMEYQAARYRQEMNDRNASKEDAIRILHEDWPGDEFNKNVELAKRVYRSFGDDNFKSVLNENGLGNDPSVLKFLARIGSVISEDLLIEGEKGSKGAEESVYDAAFPSMKDMPDRQ